MTPISSIPASAAGQAAAAGLPTGPASLAGQSTGATSPATGGPGDLPFSRLLTGMLEDVNHQQHQVGTELQRLTTGESDNVHDLVVSVAKADLALRLVLEVRDQLIASYQEVMRMQM